MAAKLDQKNLQFQKQKSVRTFFLLVSSELASKPLNIFIFFCTILQETSKKSFHTTRIAWKSHLTLSQKCPRPTDVRGLYVSREN